MRQNPLYLPYKAQTVFKYKNKTHHIEDICYNGVDKDVMIDQNWETSKKFVSQLRNYYLC